MDQRTKDDQKTIDEIRQDLLRAIRAVSKSEDGVTLLRYIMLECGYKRPSITANPNTGEINDRATLYNEARRNLWLELRQLIPKGQINRIEMER